ERASASGRSGSPGEAPGAGMSAEPRAQRRCASCARRARTRQDSRGGRMSAPMSRDAVDETLAGLGAAHDRIAAAMFAVDSHPGLAYLRGGGVAGLTETRWATLRPEVDLLWAHFGVLGDLVERARGIRSQRRPDDADWDV